LSPVGEESSGRGDVTEDAPPVPWDAASGRGNARRKGPLRLRSLVRSRYLLPGFIFGLHMAALFAGRVALLVAHPGDFARMGWGETLHAFVRGALFDASISLTFVGIPLLLLMLPFDWAASRWWRAAWGWLGFASLVAFTFVVGGDVVYFGHVHRHAGSEAATAGNDLDILLAVAFGEHLLAIALVVSCLGAVGYALHRVIGIRVDAVKRKPLAAGAVFGIFLLMVLLVRGGFGRKPVNIVNAFDGMTVSGGYLVLNGPFSLYHSLRGSSTRRLSVAPMDEALREVRARLASPAETFVDERFPLMRKRAGGPGERPNVVMLMLESWDSLYVDRARAAAGLPPYGATPVFDRLCEKGALFTRFYSTGQRSVEAFSAVLAGMPAVPGVPSLGYGMEQSRLCYLGRLAKNEGYATYFLRGAHRGSFRLDAIAELAGFDTYLGAEDIEAAAHGGSRHRLGVWDRDLYARAHEVISSGPKPFLAFVFNLSTHPPYSVPGPEWRKFPRDLWLDRFLNSLRYSDWALGRFLEDAEGAGWFDDTVFFVFGDQMSGLCAQGTDFHVLHHVPCLVFGPGVEPGVRDAVGGQLDLFPTVVHLAGWGTPYASFGRSLFDGPRGEEPAALCVTGEAVTWIEKEGWLAHDYERRLVSGAIGGGGPDLDRMERRLLCTVQVALDLFARNRIYPAAGH
jgi:hypothetical protein